MELLQSLLLIISPSLPVGRQVWWYEALWQVYRESMS